LRNTGERETSSNEKLFFFSVDCELRGPSWERSLWKQSIKKRIAILYSNDKMQYTCTSL